MRRVARYFAPIVYAFFNKPGALRERIEPPQYPPQATSPPTNAIRMKFLCALANSSPPCGTRHEVQRGSVKEAAGADVRRGRREHRDYGHLQ